MHKKSGREDILYNYIWSFPVYIYTHTPDAGISLNWHKEKTPINSDTAIFSKKTYFSLSLIKANETSKN